VGRHPKPQFIEVRVLAAVLLLLCAATVAGCTSPVEGYALPEGFAGTYRDHLGREDLDNMAWRDTVMMLDPCGFLPDVAVATLGTATYVGGAQSFAGCQAVFKPAVTDKGIGRVAVDLSTRSTQPANTTVGGVPVYMEKGLGCLISVPYRADGFSYWVYSSDGPEGFGHELDACEEGLAFVSAAIPTLGAIPLRSQTTRGFNTPLATLDPCAALDHLEIDYTRWQIFTNIRAYWCEFRFDGEDESTQYGWTSTQKPLDLLVHAPDIGHPVITIDGIRAVQNGRCSLDLYLGESAPRVVDLDGDGPPTDDYWALQDHWVDVVEFTGRGECPRLTEVATAIITAYRAATPA
jgi:hypothetical protein